MHRYIYLLVSFAVTVLIVYGLFRWMMRPQMYVGDVMEDRTCRVCIGASKGCESCEGDGRVKVIVPGVNRPSELSGEVYEDKVRHPKNIRWIRMPDALPGAAAPGAIEGATVTLFMGDLKVREVKTSKTGRFSCKLKPGVYKACVVADGYKPYEKQLDIPVITDVLWLEKVSAPSSLLEQRKEPRSVDVGLLTRGFGLEKNEGVSQK